MKWLKRIKTILDKEPELWLAYLHGQKYDKLTHLSEDKKKYSGLFTRFAIWIFLLLRQTRFRFKPSNKKCKFLVYAGTVNQKNSLEQTILALRRNDQVVCALAPKKILNKSDVKDKVFIIKTYGFWEMLKSFLVLISRFNSLRKQLKNKNRNLVKNDLNVFLNIYDELVYFERLLREVNPDCVIVANDHNGSNRSLLALARESGIKTAYMQHASVSNLFPAINFDYTFLDGAFSLNTYRDCESNFQVGIRKIENRKVFLSGQKKFLKKLDKNTNTKIGVALNALDSVEESIKLVNYLSVSGFQIKLRWHPGLSKRVVLELKKSLKEYEIEVSDPKKESLTDFFSSIKFLVAGNSSIHLEAALSNVMPIYYEISKTEISDYYLYVENKLARKCTSFQDIKDTISLASNENERVNIKSVQFYSSTYSTEWEGKEGELVAQILIGLSENSSLPIKAVCL